MKWKIHWLVFIALVLTLDNTEEISDLEDRPIGNTQNEAHRKKKKAKPKQCNEQ
jgi:hypothetical protein